MLFSVKELCSHLRANTCAHAHTHTHTHTHTQQLAPGGIFPPTASSNQTLAFLLSGPKHVLLAPKFCMRAKILVHDKTQAVNQNKLLSIEKKKRPRDMREKERERERERESTIWVYGTGVESTR